MKMLVSRLCHVDQRNCPELYHDPGQKPEKEIIIHDDFGQSVRMSRAQLGVLVTQAKDGKFDDVVE